MEVGGCDLADLARRYGTPLYVYDEETAVGLAREFVLAMGARGSVLYSAKAFYSPAFLALLRGTGVGVEVASGGELHLALAAGFTGDQIHVLGNNKSREEIEAAYSAGATLVIDGAHEFDLITSVVRAPERIRCEIRVSPGISARTHQFIATGQLDSKFGFALEGGAAYQAARLALAHPDIDLVGLHSHIGSQISDLGGHQAALEAVLDLAAQLRRDAAWFMPQISAGGGLAIAQREEEAPPTPTEFVTALLDWLASGARRRGLDQPLLLVEPGRAIAGPAGVAVYTVGAIKDVPGIRRYVAVDGGMGDNLRPKLYGARYQPMAVKAPGAEATAKVTIVGKYCESTDVLATDEPMPNLEIGDLICFPAAGAYQMSMASNYNGLPRPAVVLVKDGKSRLMRRRETASDLLRSEIF